MTPRVEWPRVAPPAVSLSGWPRPAIAVGLSKQALYALPAADRDARIAAAAQSLLAAGADAVVDSVGQLLPVLRGLRDFEI